MKFINQIILLVFVCMAIIGCGEKAQSSGEASNDDTTTKAQAQQAQQNNPKIVAKDLPKGFSYNILEDETNPKLDKNSLTIEINKKLTEGELLTLAEKLFKTKPLRGRFYMFYVLPGMNLKAGAWATSHYLPDVEVKILGSTIEEDNNAATSKSRPEGERIGRWREEQYTRATYTITKEKSGYSLEIKYPDGQTTVEAMSMSKSAGGKMRFDYSSGEYNGEYYMLAPKSDLEFYNGEGKRFTKAKQIQ